MTPQIERRMVAFVRTIANRCHSCMRRSDENCRGCAGAWANSIMADYENDTLYSRPNTDYSLANRQRRIIEALKSAERPLKAVEIDLSDICSKILKHWTIIRMTKEGQIIHLTETNPWGSTTHRYALPHHNYNTTKEPTHEPNHNPAPEAKNPAGGSSRRTATNKDRRKGRQEPPLQQQVRDA